MKLHRNTTLGLAGRDALIYVIEEGMSPKAAPRSARTRRNRLTIPADFENILCYS